MDKEKEFQTVGDLIDHLVKLERERILIIDVGGNTFPMTDDDINLWNPTDEESPVAVMTNNWLDSA